MTNEPVGELSTVDCPACGQSISISLDAGVSAFACPLCGEAFQVDGAAAMVAMPVPPPAALPMHRGTQKWSNGAIAITSMLIVGVFVGVWALVASQMPVGDQKEQGEQAEWPGATQSGHTIDGVTVRVQSVAVGAVRAKNADGKAFTSDRTDYWTVRLRIRNGSEKPIEYRTWHATEFRGETPSAAAMKDDLGKRFVMQEFEDVSRLQGQTISKTLAPGESTLDVIVFEAPQDLDREQVKELRLELPGAACQVKGVFRQSIPKSLIE